jgi:hypothetical protein
LFSPGTLASSTTKTGHHDIAESGIKHHKPTKPYVKHSPKHIEEFDLVLRDQTSYLKKKFSKFGRCYKLVDILIILNYMYFVYYSTQKKYNIPLMNINF